MGTYIIVLICMFAVYYVLNMLMHSIPQVEAGTTTGLKCTRLHRVPSTLLPSYKKEKDGNSFLYRRFMVKGQCMEEKGIKDGEIIDVRILDPKCVPNIPSGTVVLIFLNDKNFQGYKLRVIKEIHQNEAITFYYKNGVKKESSKPHPLKSIIGVVENDKNIQI